MEIDRITPLANGSRRSIRAKVEKHDVTLMELQIQVARLDAKLSFVLWGVGFLISTQIAWFLAHI